MIKQKDKTKITLMDLLMSNTQGLTIKEIMDITQLARHTILARLHLLIGEGKVNVRQINMAKLHYWKEHLPSEKELLESMDKNDLIQLVPISEKHIRIRPKKIEKGREEKRSGKKPEKKEEINDKDIARRLKEEYKLRWTLPLLKRKLKGN
jgi:hypothetical protein